MAEVIVLRKACFISLPQPLPLLLPIALWGWGITTPNKKPGQSWALPTMILPVLRTLLSHTYMVQWLTPLCSSCLPEIRIFSTSLLTKRIYTFNSQSILSPAAVQPSDRSTPNLMFGKFVCTYIHIYICMYVCVYSKTYIYIRYINYLKPSLQDFFKAAQLQPLHAAGGSNRSHTRVD